MLSLFDREKQQEKDLRKKVTRNSNIVVQRSTELREEIPEATDHPILNEIKHEGSKLAEEGDELLEKLGELRTLKKPVKKAQLKTLILDADLYSRDVKTWDTKAITSIQSHKLGYLTPAMSGATTRNNSTPTSSSTVDEPYVHPANYWDCDLVDKINAAGKTPPVTLIRNRAGESDLIV
ncbi:hypothetical protein QCA50_003913 [Cerrena zonata]|uniref:Uncharacterized protein n=1 Tax=Cerrena zonata TaxID=2478898 RepID=A0AAW0GFN9_9APHY